MSIKAILAVPLIAFARFALANTFCVTTADELQQALDASSDGGMYATEANVIQVSIGTYRTGSATGGQPFHYQSTQSLGRLNIEGGFYGACALQDLDPQFTILDGQNTTSVLVASTSLNFFVSNLTIQNGNNSSGTYAGGIHVVATGTPHRGLAVTQTIIRNNHGTGVEGGLYLAAGAGFGAYLSSNLIVGNSSDTSFGAGTVLGNGDPTDILHNTVVHNTSTMTNHTGGLYCAGGANAFVTDNVMWSNSHAGLQLGSASVLLEYNDIGTRTGNNPALADIGNISVDPKFVDDAGGNFHLASGSPALGVVPRNGEVESDLLSLPFARYGYTDMGAYAETVFKGTFE